MDAVSTIDDTDLRANRRSGMMRVADLQMLPGPMLSETDIAVTRIRCGSWGHGLTSSYDLEDSFLLTVQLTDFSFGLTCRGKPVTLTPAPAGAACIYEMDRTWIADMQNPFDALHFHITRPALESLADAMDAGAIRAITCSPNESVVDPVLMHLSQALLPSLASPQSASRLFVDYARLALGAHVATRFGQMELVPSRGGLARWQLRRVTEFIGANLDGNVSILDLASICGVSAGHLARAFRKSTGLAPHQWLTQRRIERARELLLGSDLSISEIALLCGFSDQSHFTRVFHQGNGRAPAAWRRSKRH
jgi:AraC family transcriptional regulator